MDLTAELARLNLDPTLADWLSASLRQAQQDAQTVVRQAAQLKTAEIKNQALTLELAYYKRIRFANKSEVSAAAVK